MTVLENSIPRRCPASLRQRKGGILRSALALLVFLAACAVLAWMLVLPVAVRQEIEARTGFPTAIGSLSSNPLGFTFTGADIVIANSADFGQGSPFLEIKSLDAKGSMVALLRRGARLSDLDLHISRATLTLDERGRLNVSSFASTLLRPEPASEPVGFHADHVRMEVDEVVFVDQSRLIPTRRSINAMLELEFSDVDRIETLFAPLIELGERIGALRPGIAAAP